MSRYYNGWEDLFLAEFDKPYFKQLRAFLVDEYANKTIFPPKNLMLAAFDNVSPAEVNVVILGQDPYIHQGQAMGLSFSVPDGVRPPPSLQNVLKEIKNDLGYDSIIKGGNLLPWANQGVLLLNSVLTVEEGKSNSHKGKGWEQFTDQVIRYLNNRESGVVFMLWGANAIAKRHLVTNRQHLVLTSAHPSPLSAYHGFFGCKHFSQANEFLQLQNKEIRW